MSRASKNVLATESCKHCEPLSPSKRHDHNHSGEVHSHEEHSHDGHSHQEHSHEGHSHAHSHSHDHDSGKKTIALLSVSVILYIIAVLMNGRWPDAVIIPVYLVTMALSGGPTFVRGLVKLFRLKFDIDSLMTIALVGAVAIGDWKEASLVAILFGLNELLEGYGSNKARRSMESLLSSAPKEAIRLDPATGSETILPIDQLKVGDIVVVKPGSSIPSDGIVARGVSSVNEAAITGESVPVDKSEGDSVFGGSLNNEGVLQVRIEKAYADSSLSRMLHLVQEAQETKTPTELFINRFARYYTPFIMISALLVLLVPPLFFGGDWQKWLYEALAVLIVGCPCALILASPVAILSGITRAARNGVLIKGGAFLEQLGKLDTIAFDKTGTLTKGEPRVERTVVFDADRFYSVAGAIERASSHPLSKAVMKELARFESESWEMERIETVAGVGVFGWRDGAEYRIGNEKSVSALTLTESAAAAIREFKEDGLTLVIVSDARSVLGIFGVADEIRAESARAIRELNEIGIRTVMLTGDHSRSAHKVAEAVGIQQWHAGLLPENKAAMIRDLAERATVGMVGDGINDAPALASAQLGIAMGKGTDAAIETADMVLMQDHLGKLPEAIRTGRQVNRIIRFNIGVALGLKLLALALAVPGLLTLWIAILSDMGATIFVTLVSLTLLLRSPRAPRRQDD